MHNIFTVLNEGYILFGKLLISSIFDKIDLDKIGSIIIGDAGLSEESIKYFNTFPKVEIMDTRLQAEESKKIHDLNWRKIVYSKAELLLKVIENYDKFIPTVMIDADSVIIEDFLPLLEGDFDAAACLRNKIGRTPGHAASSTHIGSFFIANTEKSIPFIKEWIQEIPKIITLSGDNNRIPQESPALSNIFKEYKNKIKIRNIDERIISNIEKNPPHFAKIYHLKSDWLYLTIEKRLLQPRALFFVNRYLGEGFGRDNVCQ